MRIASEELLEKLAATAPSEREAERPASKTRDWLLQHDLKISNEGRYSDDYRFVLSHCPFNPDHKDAAVFEGAEPYATMIYIAVYSGLRVSELIGLRWNDVGDDCLMVDERCCRGDWSAPKSEASNAPVAVQQHVIERIHALKLKTVSVRAGRAVRKYKAVKSDGPNDLVFQSVRDGKPMRDNNILSRFIKPAARKLGLGFVNWRCLRTSYGTWLKRHGADMKDIQGQMRHSRISTTMDIYVQDIPESRRRAVEKLPVPTVMVQ